MAPDLSGLKDGMREGVTKMAGKLSNIANNVVNTIQVGKTIQVYNLPNRITVIM